MLLVGLREDRADDRCGHRTGALLQVREHVPHEMDSTSLPAGADEHGLDRGDQPAVSVAR